MSRLAGRVARLEKALRARLLKGAGVYVVRVFEGETFKDGWAAEHPGEALPPGGALCVALRRFSGERLPGFGA